MLIAYLLNWFERIEAKFKARERARIKRLESDLAQAKLALSFYAREDVYPTTWVRGYGGAVLEDGGARARVALGLLRGGKLAQTRAEPLTLKKIVDAVRAAPVPALPTPENSDEEFEVVDECAEEGLHSRTTWPRDPAWP
jgi:hypothetical protein